MTNISYCVVYEQGGTERKLFKYTLPVHNPDEVKREIERMGYPSTVVPWELVKGYCLWSKLLWKLSKLQGPSDKRDRTVRRAMQIEKWLIVKYNKLIR